MHGTLVRELRFLMPFGTAKEKKERKKENSSLSIERPYWDCLCYTGPNWPGPCSVQSLSRVWLFTTPWTAARQASLSITNSWSLLKLMSIESVMPFNHLILCHPLLLPPSISPSLVRPCQSTCNILILSVKTPSGNTRWYRTSGQSMKHPGYSQWLLIPTPC